MTGINVKTPISGLRDWRYEIDSENIGWAIIDSHGRKMNVLGRNQAEELARIIEQAETAAGLGELAGLVFISAKPDNFLAGADIDEFDGLENEFEVRGLVERLIALFDRIEKLRIPVVAAVNGYCLGGGLELALA